MNLERLIKLSQKNWIIKLICLLISLLYSSIVQVRVYLYKTRIIGKVRSKLPIISVGNLTVGGTGKTPFVIALSKYFQRNSSTKKIFILSRGYKSKAEKIQETREIKLDSNPELDGDEPVLIKNSLKDYPKIKIFVNPNRIQTLKSLEEEFDLSKSKDNLVILDDGFQYLRLIRDLNICLIDCSDLYFAQVLPLGTARERIQAISRADLFCLTRVQAQPRKNKEKIYSLLKKYHPQAPIYEIQEEIKLYQTTLVKNRLEIAEPIKNQELEQKNLGAFCGLGNSGQFFNSLEALKLNLKKTINFPDHYNYSSVDLQKISLTQADLNLDYLVTTEKDLIKLKELSFRLKNLLVAKLEFIIPEKLENLLMSFD